MMDDIQIQYLEKLARIRLDPEQRDAFREEIGRIVAYMERLAAIDGLPGTAGRNEAGPAGSSSPTGSSSPAAIGMDDCRPDELRPSLQRADLLAMGPQATEENFTVPLAVT